MKFYICFFLSFTHVCFHRCGECLSTQSSLTSADFGLPGTKTFTFYHIKSSSEVILHDFLLLLPLLNICNQLIYVLHHRKDPCTDFTLNYVAV